MATKHLNIPNDLKSINMTDGTDDLEITVTADCTWCYSDPDGVFPDGLLAAGSYTATNPHTAYGPYTPDGAGTVTFDAVTTGTCDPDGGITGTVHSITVS
jgi:hypothetical protein